MEVQITTVIEQPNIEDVTAYWLDENANYKVLVVTNG